MKNILSIFLLTSLLFFSCYNEKTDNNESIIKILHNNVTDFQEKITEENDYLIVPLDDGKSAELIGYRGVIDEIQIPHEIQGMIITSIKGGAFLYNYNITRSLSDFKLK